MRRRPSAVRRFGYCFGPPLHRLGGSGPGIYPSSFAFRGSTAVVSPRRRIVAQKPPVQPKSDALKQRGDTRITFPVLCSCAPWQDLRQDAQVDAQATALCPSPSRRRHRTRAPHLPATKEAKRGPAWDQSRRNVETVSLLLHSPTCTAVAGRRRPCLSLRITCTLARHAQPHLPHSGADPLHHIVPARTFHLPVTHHHLPRCRASQALDHDHDVGFAAGETLGGQRPDAIDIFSPKSQDGEGRRLEAQEQLDGVCSGVELDLRGCQLDSNHGGARQDFLRAHG